MKLYNSDIRIACTHISGGTSATIYFIILYNLGLIGLTGRNRVWIAST